jgi:septal ring factor EnvC (AmiA/AmiB activator)
VAQTGALLAQVDELCLELDRERTLHAQTKRQWAAERSHYEEQLDHSHVEQSALDTSLDEQRRTGAELEALCSRLQASSNELAARNAHGACAA